LQVEAVIEGAAWVGRRGKEGAAGWSCPDVGGAEFRLDEAGPRLTGGRTSVDTHNIDNHAYRQAGSPPEILASPE
jgi:hypothetical protein